MFEKEMQTIQDQKVALMRSMVENFQRDRNNLIKLTLYQNEIASRLQSTHSQDLSNKKSAPHWSVSTQGSCQKTKILKSALIDIVQQVSFILTCESNATLLGMLEKEETKFIQAHGTAQARVMLEQCNANKMAAEENPICSNIKQEYSTESRTDEETPKQAEVPIKLEESDENENPLKAVHKVNRKQSQGFKIQADPEEKTLKGKVKTSKKRNVLFEKLKSISLNPNKKEVVAPKFDLKEALGSLFKSKISSVDPFYSPSSSEKDRPLVDEDI